MNSNPALHELDDATIISELEAQGEEMVRQWSSLLSTAHMQEQANSNSTNNNINGGAGNNNNQAATESGCVLASFSLPFMLTLLDVKKPHGARRCLKYG